MLDPVSGDKTDYATFDVSRNTPDSPGCPTEGAAKAPFVFSPDFKRLVAVQNVDPGGKSLGWINSSGASCANQVCGPSGFEPVAPINGPTGWDTVTVPLSFGFDAKGQFYYTKRRTQCRRQPVVHPRVQCRCGQTSQQWSAPVALQQ